MRTLLAPLIVKQEPAGDFGDDRNSNSENEEINNNSEVFQNNNFGVNYHYQLIGGDLNNNHTSDQIAIDADKKCT